MTIHLDVESYDNAVATCAIDNARLVSPSDKGVIDILSGNDQRKWVGKSKNIFIFGML